MRTIASVLALLVLAACATTEEQGAAGRWAAKTTTEVGQAAQAPLTDLNLVRADIPPVLAAAAKAPYGIPEQWSCAGMADEIVELDAALGADLDTPQTERNPSLIERGFNLVTDQAIGQVRGVTQAVVPYRGWVRKLSGAERYSKEVAAAIAAGTVRRAFLKGLARAENCASASPR